MAEYIEREKTIAETDKADLLVGDNAKWAKEMLYRVPTADVVPVVRCENCKYFEIDEEDELGECKCGYISLSYGGVLYPHRTDFCNYGERKSDK